jgi:hypothetical protein
MDFDLEWMVSEFIEQVSQRGRRAPARSGLRGWPKERTCPRKDPNEATPDRRGPLA